MPHDRRPLRERRELALGDLPVHRGHAAVGAGVEARGVDVLHGAADVTRSTAASLTGISDRMVTSVSRGAKPARSITSS